LSNALDRVKEVNINSLDTYDTVASYISKPYRWDDEEISAGMLTAYELCQYANGKFFARKRTYVGYESHWQKPDMCMYDLDSWLKTWRGIGEGREKSYTKISTMPRSIRDKLNLQLLCDKL
jgi:hypothetical protein